MADKVKIDIETTGDPRGAERVEKSLSDLEKQTDKSAKATKEASNENRKNLGKAGESADRVRKKIVDALKTLEERQEALAATSEEAARALEGETIPAVEKLDRAADQTGETLDRKTKPGLDDAGEAAKKSGGGFGALKDKIDDLDGALGFITGGILAAAAGLVVKVFQSWDEALKNTREEAGKTLPELETQLKKVAEAQDDTLDPAAEYNELLAQAAQESERLNDELARRLQDTERLAEAEKNVALARLESEVSDPAERARQRGQIESRFAQESFDRQTAAAQEVLAARQQELQEARAQLLQQRGRVSGARSQLSDFENFGGNEARAPGLDPALNRDVDDATRSRLALDRLRTGAQNRLANFENFTEAFDDGGDSETAAPAAGSFLELLNDLKEAFKNRRKEQDELAAIEAELAVVTEDEQKARDARSAAIQNEADRLASAAESEAEAERLAQERVDLLRREVEVLREEVTRREQGVERQIFETNQEANRLRQGSTTSTNGATPAASPVPLEQALLLLPETGETRQIRQLLEGGIVANEIAELGALVRDLAISLRNESAFIRNEIDGVKRAVSEAESQLADLS